jgi:hypothetical protein
MRLFSQMRNAVELKRPFTAWIVAGVMAGSGLGVGCSRAPKAVPTTSAEAKPSETPGLPSPATPLPTPFSKPTPAAPATPVAVSKPIAPAIPSTPNDQLTVAELENRFFRPGLPVSERSEIIQLLGAIATPPAADALVHIFEREKRMETRMEAFQVAYDLPDDTCREQKFTLLKKAVAPDKVQFIRLGAVQSLSDYDDPRVPALLQTLAQDKDAEVRKVAAEQLRERQQ